MGFQSPDGDSLCPDSLAVTSWIESYRSFSPLTGILYVRTCPHECSFDAQ